MTRIRVLISRVLDLLFSRRRESEPVPRNRGRPVKVISTGGLAILFNDHTSAFDAVEPDLTITGLALLYERLDKPA